MNIIYEIPVKNPSDSDEEGGVIGGESLYIPINSEIKKELELDQEVEFLVKGKVKLLESTERNNVSNPDMDHTRLELSVVTLVQEETNEFTKMAEEDE